jgi:hypothetical protein
MACRWVTIFGACLNRKFYGLSKPYLFWTNHVLVFFPSFTIMVTVTADRWRRSNVRYIVHYAISLNSGKRLMYDISYIRGF